MYKFFPITILAAGLVLVSCASVKIKTPEANEIKKVAFVGFEVFRRTDGSMVGIIKDATSDSSNPQTQEVSRICYDTFIEVVKRETEWEFISPESITSSSQYNEFFAENGRSTTLIFDMGKRYHLKDIATGNAIDKMTVSQRDSLMDELGVDALVALEVLAYPGKTTSSLSLFFVKYRMTLNMFHVYTRGMDAPVIQMKNVIGNTAKSGHISVSLPFISIMSNDTRGLIGATEEMAKKVTQALKK